MSQWHEMSASAFPEAWESEEFSELHPYLKRNTNVVGKQKGEHGS